jgi:hypothetical protein
MLEYAANGVAHWPMDEIRSLFTANCAAASIDPDEELAKFLGPDADQDKFWNLVKTNLQAGKVRMLFVADQIPQELRKIVEFLNRQKDPAEVLALELRQFEGEGGLKTLVPHVYGQTEEALQKKATMSERRAWDKETIYEELNRRFGPEVVDVAKKVAQWMETNADASWGIGGKIDGSIGSAFVWNGVKLYPVQISTNGRVSVNFGYCIKGPFESEEKRSDWLRRLNRVDGIDIPEDAIIRFPSLQLALLKDETRLKGFLEVMDWFASELRKPVSATSSAGYHEHNTSSAG